MQAQQRLSSTVLSALLDVFNYLTDKLFGGIINHIQEVISNMKLCRDAALPVLQRSSLRCMCPGPLRRLMKKLKAAFISLRSFRAGSFPAK